MVVKILSGGGGGGGFGGIDYNEEKVEKGEAHVVEMVNMDGLIDESDYTARELKEFFEEYSERNRNVKKPQFHVTFSVKGNEMSHEEVADFAKKWMAEMGYGEPGQPMIIYAHHDTGNNHIHVITSRVAPDGHKIDHNNERIRSRQAVKRLMGEQIKISIDKDRVLTSYTFASVNQFMAIFQTSGYRAFTHEGDVVLKRDGMVVDKIPITEVEKHCAAQTSNGRKAREIGYLLHNLAPTASTPAELASNAMKTHGIGIVWLGKPDAPYGYMVVDHRSGVVYNGSDVMKIKPLLQHLTPPQKKISQVAAVIDSIVTPNSDITTRELNDMLLQKTGCHIRQGALTYGHTKMKLSPDVMERLSTNDRTPRPRPINLTAYDHTLMDNSRRRNLQARIDSKLPSSYRHLSKAGQGGGGGQTRDWEVGRAREYGDDTEAERRSMTR